MKILYHHRTASRDGQAVHIDEMIEALRAQGHTVRVVAPDLAGEGPMGRKVGWVHRLKGMLPKAMYELLELGYSLHAYRQLVRAAREFRPDVLYERYNLYLVAGALVRKWHRLPLLLEVNAPLVHERSRYSGGLGLPALARWAENFVWRSADAVLPVTQVLADHVRQQASVGGRVVVIPNGINRSHFDSAPPPDLAKQQLGLERYLILGFTGFVREWHGVDRVVSWLASAHAPENALLLIVGDGPARASLEALARQLGVADRVRITGVVERSRVPDYVAAFDIALQPAVTAYASPLKLMEYLVLGKAVVAPREPNLEEILRHDVNALLFDGQVPGALEEALTRLCADVELRSRLGNAARSTIDRLDLTWSGNARRVVQIGQGLCCEP